MKLTCPNGHHAVVRHDPESIGMRGMCDMCGWAAPYQVAEAEYAEREQRESNHGLLKAQEEEQKRRAQLPGPAEERRGQGQQARR